MKTEMQREYEQLCRIDENPGVQGLAQLGRNAINRVSRLESQLASADARTAELESALKRQAAAVKMIDMSHVARAETMMQHAQVLHDQSNTEALESERAANALMTERIAELECGLNHLSAAFDADQSRIAELEAALRRVRRWCMGSGYSASVQVAMKEWIDGGMVGGMPELTGLESAIDAARANGGEG